MFLQLHSFLIHKDQTELQLLDGLCHQRGKKGFILSVILSLVMASGPAAVSLTRTLFGLHHFHFSKRPEEVKVSQRCSPTVYQLAFDSFSCSTNPWLNRRPLIPQRTLIGPVIP